jgi:NADH-quinone oxidoreductase subunit C
MNYNYSGEESITIKKLKDKFPQYILSIHNYRGDDTALIKRETITEVCKFIKDDKDLDYNFLTDLTVVDYLGNDPRFEVVYHFYSLKHNHRVRIKAGVPESDPTIDSLTPLYKGANWFEREAWDMYGIKFNGHPDLRRILLYEEFKGHPLRKDYPIDERQPLVGPKN